MHPKTKQKGRTAQPRPAFLSPPEQVCSWPLHRGDAAAVRWQLSLHFLSLTCFYIPQVSFDSTSISSSSSSSSSSSLSLLFFSTVLKTHPKQANAKNPRAQIQLCHIPEIQLKLYGNYVTDSVLNLKNLSEHNIELLLI